LELAYNLDARFTRWVVNEHQLTEPFVLVDVGVQRGEHPRWHQLGSQLVVHGFDALEEAVAELARRGTPNRHYHCIAAGAADEERTFYFNPANPTASSMYPQGESRFDIVTGEEPRKVPVRRLDTLLAQGVIPRADFLKVDVEGFEKDVLLGARELLAAGILGVEAESNFGVSEVYPEGHFATVHALLLEHHLLVHDIGFNRVPRATFQRALARSGRKAISRLDQVGKPATLDVLFCRDLIDEADQPGNYVSPCRPVSDDQLIKMAIICELHGLNDIAVDTLERFADRLKSRMDIERAIALLADPHCRPAPARKFGRDVLRSMKRRARRLLGKSS
jgi:FkbM family methyltransferase